jgi:uncharacterized protein (TIGR00297 family)
MSANYLIPFLLIVFAAFLSVITHKLNIVAAIIGIVVAVLIFMGAGYVGIAMLATFFVLGSASTSWKMNIKLQSGYAEKDKGQRTTGQVVANGGVAAIAGLLAWINPVHENLFRLMVAASLASATADTLSSELGTVYGRKFYNIITFKTDVRGMDGVISAEGTIIGIVGSLIISVIYCFSFGWNGNFVWIIVAGTIGNIADSVLGAVLERKNILSNNAVNFLNTLIAALTVLLFTLIT